VVFAQRFGSALNLKLHFHALVLDGAFISPSERLAPSFQHAAPLSDADVAELVEQLALRVTRYLQRSRCPARGAPTAAASRCTPRCSCPPASSSDSSICAATD